MQVVCGQCGTLLKVEDGADVFSLECPNCGHEIFFTREDDDRQEVQSPPTQPIGREDQDFAGQAHRALHEQMAITCSRCGTEMQVSKRHAGQVVRCFLCSNEICVPFPDDEKQIDFFSLGLDAEVTPAAAASGWLDTCTARRRRHLLLVALAVLLVVLLLGGILLRGIACGDKTIPSVQPKFIEAPRDQPTPQPRPRP